MPQYAQNTSVSVEASEAEIKRTLIRYGADQFLSGWDSSENLAVIGFRIQNRQVKMMLPLPDRTSKEFTETPSGRYARDEAAAFKAWEQACRQRWRALALIVKAKLEAVEAGISTIEREFLADVVLTDGRTFYQWAEPQIKQMYLNGKMPPLLTAGPTE